MSFQSVEKLSESEEEHLISPAQSAASQSSARTGLNRTPAPKRLFSDVDDVSSESTGSVASPTKKRKSFKRRRSSGQLKEQQTSETNIRAICLESRVIAKEDV